MNHDLNYTYPHKCAYLQQCDLYNNDTIKNLTIEDKTRKKWCFTKNINLNHVVMMYNQSIKLDKVHASPFGLKLSFALGHQI